MPRRMVSSSLDQHVVDVGVAIDQEAHVRSPHLLPALAAVAHPLARVRLYLFAVELSHMNWTRISRLAESSPTCGR